MKVCVALLLLSIGCSPAKPAPSDITFATHQAMMDWFFHECPPMSPIRQVAVFDGTPAPGPYMTEYYTCERVGPIVDVTLEVRSNGHQVCGAKLGPAKLEHRIDANLVLPWFTDQALGERVATALATEQATMVDGLFVGLLQDMKNSTKFLLVIDGCGRSVHDEVLGKLSMF